MSDETNTLSDDDRKAREQFPRETNEVAEGPNTDGYDAMARNAHKLPEPPPTNEPAPIPIELPPAETPEIPARPQPEPQPE